MDLYHRSRNFRGWVRTLRCGHEFDNADRWSSSRWCWSKCALLWRNDDPWLYCPACQTSNLYRVSIKYVRHIISRRAPSGWRPDGQGFLEVVFLGICNSSLECVVHTDHIDRRSISHLVPSQSRQYFSSSKILNESPRVLL